MCEKVASGRPGEKDIFPREERREVASLETQQKVLQVMKDYQLKVI